MSNPQSTSRVVPPVDITTMTNPEFDSFVTGYLSGYRAATEAAHEMQAAHWRAVHHRAYVTVQRMAGEPTHAELTARRTTYTPWSEPEQPWAEVAV